MEYAQGRVEAASRLPSQANNRHGFILTVIPRQEYGHTEGTGVR